MAEHTTVARPIPRELVPSGVTRGSMRGQSTGWAAITSNEDLFRRAKALLRSRPIFHSCDAAIRSHVSCSFLALLLKKPGRSDADCRCHPRMRMQLRDLETAYSNCAFAIARPTGCSHPRQFF